MRMSEFEQAILEVNQPVITSNLPLFTEYMIDMEFTDTTNINENFQIASNHDFVLISGDPAIKYWLYKALIISRGQYPIYDNQYGQAYNDVVWNMTDKGLIENTIMRDIQLCCEQLEYIIGVDFKSIVWNNNELTITFFVNTVYSGFEYNFSIIN